MYNMKKVAIYTRVSTMEQINEGYSIDEQKNTHIILETQRVIHNKWSNLLYVKLKRTQM